MFNVSGLFVSSEMTTSTDSVIFLFSWTTTSSAYWMFHCVGKCVDNKELQRQSQVLPRNQVFPQSLDPCLFLENHVTSEQSVW